MSKGKNVALYKKINFKRFITFNYLLGHPCVDCGENNPVCLEFDHIDPKKKITTISDMIVGYNYSIEDLILEINKCEIRCGNCHAKRTSKMFIKK